MKIHNCLFLASIQFASREASEPIMRQVLNKLQLLEAHNKELMESSWTSTDLDKLFQWSTKRIWKLMNKKWVEISLICWIICIFFSVDPNHEKKNLQKTKGVKAVSTSNLSNITLLRTKNRVEDVLKNLWITVIGTTLNVS